MWTSILFSYLLSTIIVSNTFEKLASILIPICTKWQPGMWVGYGILHYIFKTIIIAYCSINPLIDITVLFHMSSLEQSYGDISFSWKEGLFNHVIQQCYVLYKL